MSRREVVVLPIQLRAPTSPSVSPEEREQELLLREAEKRKNEWENQLERMRQRLLRSAITERARHHLTYLEQEESHGWGDILDEEEDISDEESSSVPLSRLEIDMSEYRPEHITVQVKGDVLLVQASCEDLKDGTRTLKEYAKRIEIPRGVDPSQLVSRYSRDGVLTVEIPHCSPSSPTSSRESLRHF